MRDLPSIILHRGYVANSPTLMGPVRTRGLVQGCLEVRESPSHIRFKRLEPSCMGDDMPPGTMLWFDTSAPIESGRLAVYVEQHPDGHYELNCKRLFLIDDIWFAVCRWYVLPVEWMIGVTGWAAVVAEMQMPESWYAMGLNPQTCGWEAEENAWRAELNGHAINQRAIASLAQRFDVAASVQ